MQASPEALAAYWQCVNSKIGRGCKKTLTGCEPEDLPEGEVVEPHRGPQSTQLGNASTDAMRSRPDLCWIQLACRDKCHDHDVFCCIFAAPNCSPTLTLVNTLFSVCRKGVERQPLPDRAAQTEQHALSWLGNSNVSRRTLLCIQCWQQHACLCSRLGHSHLPARRLCSWAQTAPA